MSNPESFPQTKLTYCGIELPYFGPEVRKTFERLVMSGGQFVPVTEIVRSTAESKITGMGDSSLNRRFNAFANAAVSQFSRYAPQLSSLLCLVRAEDESLFPENKRGNPRREALAYALILREELGELRELASEEKKGLLICRLGHEDFISRLDPNEIIIPPPLKFKTKKVEGNEKESRILTTIEGIRDEETRKFMTDLSTRNSMFKATYGEISEVDGDFTKIDAQELISITLDALLTTGASSISLRKVCKQVLDGGVFFEIEGDMLKKQTSEFTLSQVIAFIIFYSEYRKLKEDDTNKRYANNIRKLEDKIKIATEGAIEKVGKEHMLTKVLSTKLKKRPPEQDF